MNTSKLGVRCALVSVLMQTTALCVPSISQVYAATRAEVAFDIPAGSLAAVITAIASAAHEQIAFSSDLVAPFQAGPIRGRKTVRAAIAEALAGTHLTVVTGEGGVLAIRGGAGKAAAVSGAATDIADIDVTGNGSGMHDDGFQAGDSGASLRLGDTPIKEVPRTIAVVTKDVLDTQAITNATDAVTNVSGVTIASSGTASPTFTIRGFETTGYDINGLGAASYASLPIDDVERVEVLKGPTSILTGTTAEGGIVNISTKRPTDQTIRDVTVRIGSYGYKTLAFDLGGLVPQTEGLTYRFNISGNQTDKNYAGYTNGHENLISPALQWQDHDTSVLFGLRYIDERVLPNQYTFVPYENINEASPILPLPRGINQINPNLHVSTKDITLYNDASHDFGTHYGVDVAINNHFQYLHEDVLADTFSFSTTSGPGQNVYGAFQYLTRFKLDKLTDRSDVTLKFDLGWAHQLSKIGFDFTQGLSSTGYDNSDIEYINPYAHNFANIFYTEPNSNTYDVRYKNIDAGVYYLEKFDTLDDRLHILGQVRNDHFKYEDDYGYFGQSPTATPFGQNGLSWTAGGAFDVTKWFTVYGNRSNGFYPSSGFNPVTNAPLEPEQRDQSEVGGRFFLFDKRLTLTPSFYKLVSTNVSISDPSDPTGQTILEVGGLQSRGFEFDAQGQISNSLAVIASFADTHTAYTTPLYSFTMPGVPQYTASLWSIYTFQDGFAKGFTFGFGLHGNTSSVIESADTLTTFYKVPGYVVEDMMIGYARDRYSINLKINNLGNKYYYLPTYNSGQITIAQGRNALATLKYSF